MKELKHCGSEGGCWQASNVAVCKGLHRLLYVAPSGAVGFPELSITPDLQPPMRYYVCTLHRQSSVKESSAPPALVTVQLRLRLNLQRMSAYIHVHAPIPPSQPQTARRVTHAAQAPAHLVPRVGARVQPCRSKVGAQLLVRATPAREHHTTGRLNGRVGGAEQRCGAGQPAAHVTQQARVKRACARQNDGSSGHVHDHARHTVARPAVARPAVAGEMQACTCSSCTACQAATLAACRPAVSLSSHHTVCTRGEPVWAPTDVEVAAVACAQLARGHRHGEARTVTDEH